MKKLIAACLVGLACVVTAETKESAKAQPKELKVLMIGNSFSICVGKEMPKVAKSMGLRLDLGSLFIGGCPLEKHWKNWCAGTNAAPYKFDRTIDGKKQKGFQANIPDAVSLEKWDVVTFQQASHFSWKADSYQPYADQLQSEIRKLLPEAEFVWQETWSYTPWDKRLKGWKIDQNEMYEKLHAAYAGVAKAKDQRVIPMGTAVQLWRKQLPVVYKENSFGGDVCGSAKFETDKDGKIVPKGDVFHLNGRGHYLQALVWTAKLFGVDVTKCTYAPKYVKPEEAELMKRVAMEAVNGK